MKGNEFVLFVKSLDAADGHTTIEWNETGMSSYFPSELSIGGVRVAPGTVLAPMAGVTDTVFRRFIRRLGGCGLIMTEFTSSHGVKASTGRKKSTKTLKYLAFSP